MWNMKRMFILVMSGTTGIVTKDKCESHTRKTSNRFTTKYNYTKNIIHNTESTAV
jgi:hypothetical protein